MSIGVVLLIFIGAIVLLLILDLIFFGGAMTMGTMYGMTMMVTNPIGIAILLVLLSILGVMVYAVFIQ